MSNNNDKKILNVPALRFPEFSGEWETHSLGEIGETIIGLTYKPSDVVENKGTIVFRSSNIQNGAIDYSDLVRVNKTIKTRMITKVNDILVCARNGSQRLIGKNAIIKQGDTNNTFGAFMMVYRSEDNQFIFPLLSTKRYISQVGENLGARINQITTSDFNGFEFYFPTNHKERTKISELFRLLDERIAAQNKIIEDLKKLKSAISLKMLHSDSWEQFRIKDIAIIGRGRVISSVEISQQKNPTYPVYSSQTSNEGIMGYLDDYMFEGEYISWTTDGANAGTVFYRNGKFNCTNVCGLLKLKKGFDTHFVSLVLAEATKKYVSVNLANPKLMNNTMGNIQIRLPKLEEQKRISIVFRRLHELLAIHNNLLTEYSKQKQYLLSQMFI